MTDEPTPDAPYTPTELEQTAHEAFVRDVLPKFAERMDTLIRMAVQTSGNADLTIWLPLAAIAGGLNALTFAPMGGGATVPAARKYHVEGRVHILAAVALRRLADRCDEHAARVMQAAFDPANEATEDAPRLGTVEWTDRDTSLCYDDAIERVDALEPAPPGEGAPTT